jgi:hypothetical protein
MAAAGMIGGKVQACRSCVSMGPSIKGGGVSSTALPKDLYFF